MAYENIRLEIADQIATITVDRPERRNAIDRKTIGEVYRALDAIAADESAGVMIFTGGGEKVFVAGADVNDLLKKDLYDGLDGELNRLYDAIERHPRPSIAAVNGFALGGGCELALACDIRVASDNARFGLPELGLGITPGAGGTQRLARIVGYGKAKEIILTGAILDAAEAERIGLVSAVVPRSRLLESAQNYAEKILTRAPLALQLAKFNIDLTTRIPKDAAMTMELMAQGILFETADKKEGMTAFLEKRKPNFKGT